MRHEQREGLLRGHLAVGEYYIEGQVVAGEWLGMEPRLPSLDRPVKEAQFLALCDNLDSNTGEKLTVRAKYQSTCETATYAAVLMADVK